MRGRQWALLLVISFFALSAWAGQRYAEKINWHTLKQGLLRAKESKKPLLVDFAIPKGCPRCDFLQKNVYTKDEVVEKINSDFIPVWIDLSKKLTPEEKALGEKYDYKNDCLLLFLDYEGNVIKDPQGKRMCFMDNVAPQVFIDYLDYVLREYR